MVDTAKNGDSFSFPLRLTRLAFPLIVADVFSFLSAGCGGGHRIVPFTGFDDFVTFVAVLVVVGAAPAAPDA